MLGNNKDIGVTIKLHKCFTKVVSHRSLILVSLDFERKQTRHYQRQKRLYKLRSLWGKWPQNSIGLKDECVFVHTSALFSNPPYSPGDIMKAWWRHQMEIVFALLATCGRWKTAVWSMYGDRAPVNLQTARKSTTRMYMMTSSNGNSFRVTGPLCAELTGHRWVPLPKASDAELDVFFDLCLNKQLSKQSWGWWVDTPACSLWRHCNEIYVLHVNPDPPPPPPPPPNTHTHTCTQAREMCHITREISLLFPAMFATGVLINALCFAIYKVQFTQKKNIAVMS